MSRWRSREAESQSVNRRMLLDGAVDADAIANLAVRQRHLWPESVDKTRLAPGSVELRHISPEVNGLLGKSTIHHVTLTATAGQTITAGGGTVEWDTEAGEPTERRGFDNLHTQLQGGPVGAIPCDLTGWVQVHPVLKFDAYLTGATLKVSRVTDQAITFAWDSGSGDDVDYVTPWIPIDAGDKIRVALDHDEDTDPELLYGLVDLFVIAEASATSTVPTGGCPTMGTATNILDTSQNNSFPGLAIADDGTLVALFRAGTQHDGSPYDGDIRLMTSPDGGTTWSSVTNLIESSSWDYRGATITKLNDGTLVAAIERRTSTSSNSPSGSTFISSSDNGSTWSSETVVDTGLTAWSRGMQIVELANGDLLYFSYGQNTGDTTGRMSVVVSRSTDGGATWSPLATIADGQTDVMGYTEVGAALVGSTLVALIRNDSTGELDLSTSSDSGATWSAPTSVISLASGRPTLTNRNGELFVLYRDSSTNSEYAVLARSGDAGQTWTACHTFDETPSTDRMTYGQVVSGQYGLRVLFAYETSAVNADLWFAREAS